jgi:uncharacterized iron-regulated protein
LPETWETDRLVTHPLVGRIWDTQAREFVLPAGVEARAAEARFVLLGEKHDNPDHHRLQAWALDSVAQDGRRPTVAFEMLSEDVEPALRDYMKAHPGDATGFGEAVGWEERGWSSWEIYRPLVEVALGYDLPIVTADFAKPELRRISREGFSVLPVELRERAALDRPLPPEVEATLAEEIRDAHCGMAPDAAIPAMIKVQRARDALMASRLLDTDPTEGAVLVAGAAHVRRVSGVPAYLELHVPEDEILAIGFIEVKRGVDSPEEASGTSVFDLVWFTPRLDETDPCEKFRERLEKLRDREHPPP